MRNKNKMLAAAITMVLSTSNLVYAGDLVNETTITIINPELVSIANKQDGIKFGTHLFGNSAVTLPPLDSPLYFAVTYRLVGEVIFPFELKAILSNGAQFAETTTTLVFFSKAGNLMAIQDGPFLTANCDSKNTCQWNINPTSTLKDGDEFRLFYKVKNIQVLANAGEKIKLMAQVGTTFTPTLIDTREVTFAVGAEPLDVTLEPATDRGIRISVASQNTEFNSKTTSSPEFISPQEVIMGYLKVASQATATDIVQTSSFSPWYLGNTGTLGGTTVLNAEFDSTKKVDTSLTITGGQFAASVTGTTGKVYLDIEAAKCSSVTLTSIQIEADEVDSTNAIWRFSNSELYDIVKVSSPDFKVGGCNAKIPIVIKTDGKTAINIVEDAPTATFLLDYAETNNLHDIPYGPTELSKFKPDGTVCWVYNVPGSAAADILSLRITNESSAPGTVHGTLYDKDGNQIFPAADNPPLDLLGGEIAVGETKVIFSSDIENLEGGPYTWPGRGILQMTSTLSRLEILSLLRSTLPGSPLTNVSVGASGKACEN
jgi:hypothetical protein